MVKFVNMGLFYGFGRSVGGRAFTKEGVVSEPTPSEVAQLPARAQELMRWCPSSGGDMIKFRLFQRFLDLHRDKLKRTFLNLPWFVPQQWGGVGLPVFLDKPDDPTELPEQRALWGEDVHFLPYGETRMWRPTDLDNRLCHRILQDGLVRQIKAIPTEEKIEIRDVALRRFPMEPEWSADPVLLEESDRALSFLAVDSLFTTQLRPVKKVGAAATAITRNQRIWTKASHGGVGGKEGALPAPLSLSRVLRRREEGPVYRVLLRGMPRLQRYEPVLTRESRQAAELIDSLWS
jgi:hypothetical protein